MMIWRLQIISVLLSKVTVLPSRMILALGKHNDIGEKVIMMLRVGFLHTDLSTHGLCTVCECVVVGSTIYHPIHFQVVEI